jgi:hypothetical protein
LYFLKLGNNRLKMENKIPSTAHILKKHFCIKKE